jgi:hypothetical protein
MSDQDPKDPKQEELELLCEIRQGLRADLGVIRRQLGCLLVLVAVTALAVIAAHFRLPW